MERRAFITLLGCAPIAGVVAHDPAQGLIRLYHEGQFVAEQEVAFRLNTIMKARFENGPLKVDKLELYNEFGAIISVKKIQPLHMRLGDNLTISWTVTQGPTPSLEA